MPGFSNAAATASARRAITMSAPCAAATFSPSSLRCWRGATSTSRQKAQASCSSIARLARRSIRSCPTLRPGGRLKNRTIRLPPDQPQDRGPGRDSGHIDAKTRARPPQADINSEDQMRKSTAVVVGVGAERGLGAALCRRFSIGGYHVLIAGRTAAKIDQVAATIVSSGGSATPVVMDATKEEDIVALFDRAMAPGAGYEP